MTCLIAVSGKGGVGKTTIAALLVQRLVARGAGPVLAVDADPNSCLDGVLGVQVKTSVGGVREKAREAAAALTGVSKQEYLELKIAESLVEAEGFDLIAMGRPEGPGCYCYANNVLRAALTKLSSDYPFVVLDNEAGLENLSRRIVQEIDVLLLVSDPSARGLETMARLHALALEMGIRWGALVLVVNRLRSADLPARAREIAKAIGADGVVAIPDDAELAGIAESGGSIFSLPGANPVAGKIDELIGKFVHPPGKG